MGALGTMPAHAWVALPPGGTEVYSNPNGQGIYPAHWGSRAVLVRTSVSPLQYERRLPDGTVEVYGHADGAPVGQQRVFLTSLIDPLGQALELTWDAQSRLVAITDALGQVTVLGYADADPLKITSVTDPFGRTGTFGYNAAGQLESITDVIGITSRFGYGPNDFVQSLSTPYGTTTFQHETNSLDIFTFRFVEATDPLGGTEHLEFQYQTPSLAATASSSDVPAGFGAWNAYLNRYNSFYWDKRAWALYPGDLTKAVVTHWMVGEEFAGWQKYSYVPHSIKKPLEGRTWYAYPGQTPGNEDEIAGFVGPSRVGRVLEDGTSQISQTTYNDLGFAVTKIDPIGRRTTYDYAANGRDLVAVRQTTGSLNDLLQSYGNYTAQGQPQFVTDAAGQSTTITYNALGQPLTVTNAKNETTTSTYDSLGRLATVTGPVTGATTTYTYDALNRVRTTTDPDGYTLTADYDSLDRPVRVTYPDGTYEETTYDKLDRASRRDRAGRITRYYYDAMRRLTATRDPAGRVIRQEWCPCGALDALVDANGHRTSWVRDLQGRVIGEVRADAVTTTTYTYGPSSGRLLTMTDSKGQTTTYAYGLDDELASSTYTNAVVTTPSVSYTMDPLYNRVSTMSDGTGVTTYTYHAVGELGASQIASVDGPLTDDTITYSYDELGRVTSRAIDGVQVAWVFDALGRVTSETNVLGTFGYTYDGVTTRLASVSYPNGQTSEYAYFPNAQDRRLQSIHHKYPGGATLSKFDYTYDVVGNILTWRQQADSNAVVWQYGYDRADQLTAAIKQSATPSPTVLKRYAYAYDPAGNRTAEQIDDQVTGANFDSLNHLVSQQPAGPIVVSGTVSEPATVTVQGVPAVVTPDNRFTSSPLVGTGTNTITIVATDPSGNVASSQYEVDSLGTGRTFTLDANGDLTGDGTRSFEWDARDQLVAVVFGTHRSEFAYDGLKRRVRIVERENGVIQSETKVLWCDEQICEERAVDGLAVARRVFGLGEQVGTASHYFTADHLGSVGEVVDNSGTVLTRFVYDPWGRQAVTMGTDLTTIGFTGHRRAFGGLWLTLHRAYDQELGRWLTEDPLGVQDGPNLYAYVRGRVISAWDPLGLQATGGGGVSCCAELQARRRRVHDILDSLGTGKALNPPGGPPYAQTECYPDGSSNSYIFPNTPPCLRDCVDAHEQRHRRQCRRAPGAIGSERSAYLVELGCLIRKISGSKCCSSQ